NKGLKIKSLKNKSRDELIDEILELREKLKEKESENNKLKGQLKIDSKTSSKPSSTNIFDKKLPFVIQELSEKILDEVKMTQMSKFKKK
ncbi:MAG: hypothetical protein Q9M97_00350, partial [Candidatus Gracilibacteria bacterium]|nr:hypothetical protein [Candidatus Gracilibacteria bacterium]